MGCGGLCGGAESHSGRGAEVVGHWEYSRGAPWGFVCVIAILRCGKRTVGTRGLHFG